MSSKRITLISMFTALALIVFIIEAQLPPLVPIPGIKLGLANVITLFVMVFLGGKDAFIVMILRVVLGSIFAGSIISCIYSLSGGIVSFIVTYTALKLLKTDMLPAVSVMGAIGHNVGQILIAIFITGSIQIVWYFPILFVSAILTGAFTGMTAKVVLKRCEKIFTIRGMRQ